MKNYFISTMIILFVLLSDTARANLCKDVYREKTNDVVFSLKNTLEKKENPFDLTRSYRDKMPDLSDKILDELTLRLNTEKVVKIENLGGGVNTSYKITFESGLQAAYKPVNPDRANQPTREAVAYKLSRLLGLDIVPPTVVRKISGPVVPNELQQVDASVQLFINTAKPLKKGKNSQGEKILLKGDVEFVVENSISGRRLRIFDWLINNHDRGSNAGNYLVSKVDDYVIGIDHSVSFVGHDKQAREDKVPFYKEIFLNDIEFYNKLKSVSIEKIKESLGGLNPTRVKEFLERYAKLISDFEKVLEESKKAG